MGYIDIQLGCCIVDDVLQMDHLHIYGDLELSGFSELTALPDGLSVRGYLDLEGCTALTALPDGLSVGGSIYLGGCTALTALPNGLSVGENLILDGCAALGVLPDGLSVGGNLDLEGCTALTALPDGLSVGEMIFLDNLHISSNRAQLINVPLAHSIRSAAIGRRLGDIVDHWALSWNGMRDQIIERIQEGYDDDLVLTLAPHATNAMSAHEIDCVMAGADHGDQSQYSLL